MLYPLSYSRAAFQCIKSIRRAAAHPRARRLPERLVRHAIQACGDTLYRSARPILCRSARADITATLARVFTGFKA